MSTAAEKLAALQQPRKTTNSNMALVCVVSEVLTLSQFMERYAPEASTVDDFLNAFDEDDAILQLVTIGDPREKKPFLVDGKRIYKPFPVQDREQLLERIVTQQGFAESQSIVFESRDDWFNPAPVADVAKAIKAKN